MEIPFVPSEEQGQLRTSAGRWSAARAKAEPAPAGVPWADMVDLGWLAAGFPEDQGGLGGSAFDTAIIAEELGRRLLPLPFVDVVASAQLLLALRAERLEAVLCGAELPLIAHDEVGARGMPDWVQSVARREDAGYRVCARKTGLIGVDKATAFIVSARIDHELALFWVPLASARLIGHQTLDRRHGAVAVLDDVRLGPDNLLAIGSRARKALAFATAHALVLESAEAVGAMRAALALTRDYVTLRRQFKQRIGDFQVIRHVLADMMIKTEQAYSLVLRGLEALSDPSRRRRLALATKFRAANTGLFVAGKGIQLHGGVGMTEDYEIGSYYKRLLVFSQRHGTADDTLRLYAEEMRHPTGASAAP